ncbi:bifunctional diaminohydroxyphosphoribosylaminopyrimidine deaminase/5-amino-6-(5-phosphoribosylamino)uracil reductase RibD [Chryseolinea sp. T2]|uniref:bifunctional diaminohydroxyphosphoribosylaminopyrimidine deaminase/5-amino-6-(5-phosphoribosylamino)uracil reductase RibD n=1 Tax=Chryseolinea sp. T2 TaxID=3129255 RepID=UPI0030775C4E
MEKHDHGKDVFFMRRALELADRGRGTVSPNPLVGCVIVHDGNVIGEGWHQQYGGPHAEVHAVQSVNDQQLLRSSTVYVTLEPCAHFGKTPPCADMLVRAGVQRVVISNVDPNPLVAGKGIEKLMNAGIDVSVGALQREGLDMNRRFFTMIQKGRPYIILKWAQTADGFMARENFDSKWISNVYSRQVTHKWRTEEDAILVGTNTALRDNPKLTTRDWTGRNPTRIVIDKNLSLPRNLNLFDGSAPTICYNLLTNEDRPHESCVKVDGKDFTMSMLADLQNRKIQSIIVEGGPRTLEDFVARGLWDEVRMFVAPKRFGKGLPAPRPAGTSTETDINGDRLITIRQ